MGQNSSVGDLNSSTLLKLRSNLQPHLGKTQKSDGNNFASHLRRRRQHQLVGLDGRVAENFIRKVDYAAEFYLFNVMQTYCHIVFGSVCLLTEIHYKVLCMCGWLLLSKTGPPFSAFLNISADKVSIPLKKYCAREHPPFLLIPFGAVARGENPHLHLAQT